MLAMTRYLQCIFLNHLFVGGSFKFSMIAEESSPPRDYGVIRTLQTWVAQADCV